MLNEVSQREMEGIKMINQKYLELNKRTLPPTHTLTYTHKRMLSVLQAKWTELCCSREGGRGAGGEISTGGGERN